MMRFFTQEWRVAKESYFPSKDLLVYNQQTFLAFEKDQKLFLLPHEKSDNLYLMKNKNTGEIGFVDKFRVARPGTIEVEPWYFSGIGRHRAIEILLSEINVAGSFMVRENLRSHLSKDSQPYSLSLKTYNEKERKYNVMHYKIHHTGNSYFITESHKFTSLIHLVEFFMTDPKNVLACKLKKACLQPPVKGLAGSQWIIPRAEIQSVRQVGKGNFGIVLEGKFRESTRVALKVLQQPSSSSKDEFLREVEILKSLQHPHLVQLYGCCIDSEPYMMVLEFMENGDLKNYLLTTGKITSSYIQLLQIAIDIACGMSELAILNIVHRDLAARNVLLDSTMTAKVGDFGLAVTKDYKKPKEKERLPVKWAALEVLENKALTIASDVWSFGIVLWEIFTFGETPYTNIEDRLQLQQFLKTKRLPKPDYDSSEETNFEKVYRLMKSCWQSEPKSRPTMDHIHSTLQNYLSDAVEVFYSGLSLFSTSPQARPRRPRQSKLRVKNETKLSTVKVHGPSKH